jgi:hypothetical protein
MLLGRVFLLLSCENEKVDFSKCQLLQQHLWILRTEISPNPTSSCLISRTVLNGVCETKKPQPLLHLFSGFLGRPDLFKVGGGIFAGSPFWALITL